VEIKEAAWQLADAGIDLVDSLVQHIKQGLGMNKMTSTTVLPDGTTAAAAGSANNMEYWSSLLVPGCFDQIRFDDFLLPRLVMAATAARSHQMMYKGSP
jgi:hypothetical protein